MPPNKKMAANNNDAIYIQQININSVNNKKNEVGVHLHTGSQKPQYNV